MFSKNGKARLQMQAQYPDHFRRPAAGNIEFLHSLFIFNLVHRVSRAHNHSLREKLLTS